MGKFIEKISVCCEDFSPSIIKDILLELKKAKKKHPFFPSDAVSMCAIMAEEAGEAIQAANDVYWDNGDVEKFKVELRHTAAMCIRILEKMEDDENAN